MTTSKSSGELIAFALILVAVGVRADAGERSTVVGDRFCQSRLDEISALRSATSVRQEERQRGYEDVWNECQKSDVNPLLRARAALLYSRTPASGDLPAKVDLLRSVLKEVRAHDLRGFEEVQLLEEIGNLQSVLNLRGDSLATFEDAYRTRQSIFGEKSPEAARGALILASGYAAGTWTGTPDAKRALEMSSAAVKMLATERGEKDPITIKARAYTAGIYRSLGRNSDANAIEEQFADSWGQLTASERKLAEAWQ